MSKYTDIASYRLAVKIRSYKTILVEGVTDKAILSHFLLSKNFYDENNSRYCVDDVSIINNDHQLEGLGNKNKVLMITSALCQGNDKICCMVDREWDGIDFEKINEIDFPQNKEYAYITKGHSIENYWFDVNASISFLMQNFSTSIHQNYLNELHSNFNTILKLATAYSLTAKDAHLITKLSDTIEHEDLSWDGVEFYLNETFNHKILQRSINFDFTKACNEKLNQIKTSNPEILRWLCHGHLGEQMIRACMARIAVNHGISSTIIREIERGKKTEKFHHDSNYITTCEPHIIDPLDKVLAWIRTPIY
jgi:hypothetical protein